MMTLLLSLLNDSTTQGILIGLVVIIVATIYFISVNSKKPEQVALNAEDWIPFPLVKIEKISHDVRQFRFGLQSQTRVLGLPIGQHISLKYTDENNKEVQRSYTPVSSDDDVGFVDFVIKVYYKNPPKFPDGGTVTLFIFRILYPKTFNLMKPMF